MFGPTWGKMYMWLARITIVVILYLVSHPFIKRDSPMCYAKELVVCCYPLFVRPIYLVFGVSHLIFIIAMNVYDYLTERKRKSDRVEMNHRPSIGDSEISIEMDDFESS